MDQYFEHNPHYVQLEFGEEEVSIKFLSDLDLNAFVHKPKRYFEAVRSRRPRKTQNTTEVEIYRCSLASVRELHSSTMDVIDGREYKSCDLRVLEQRENVIWRATRRLVLSSSVAATQLWSHSYFLPMDRVQLKATDTNTLAIKWSDCTHEDFETTDGNYHRLFTHFYDASQPNQAFEFIFSDSVAATAFQTSILSLRRAPLYEWTNRSPADLETLGGTVYEVQDSDPNPIKYRAIAVRRQKLDWSYARIVYCYRNFDVSFSSRDNSVFFPELHYAHYLSNHEQLNYPPQDDPEFASCTKAYTELWTEFSAKPDAISFLSSLSSYKLIYAGCATYTSTKPLRRIGPAKRSNEGGAELLVWKMRSTLRLASRWRHVSEKWLTFELRANEVARHADLVWIERKSYRQGKYLNWADIEAYGPKSQSRQGRLTFGFESPTAAEEFHLALGAHGSVACVGLGLESLSLATASSTGEPSLA
jgi:hypothetical protein